MTSGIITYVQEQLFSTMASSGSSLWQNWWEQNRLYHLTLREQISWIDKNTSHEDTIAVSTETQKKVFLDIFIPCLKEDKNPIARATAALALGKFNNNESVLSALKEALNNDASADVKNIAALSLSLLKNEKMLDELADIARNDQSKLSKTISRHYAILVLGYVKNQAAIEIFKEVLDSKEKTDNETQCAALIALANFRDKSFIPLIAGVLNNAERDVNVRACATLALGLIRDASALPELNKAANDKNDNIRESVMIAFGLIKSADSKNELVDIVNTDKTSDVRAYAALSLAQLKDKSIYPLLSSLAKKGGYHLQGACTLALGFLGDEKSLPDLHELVEKKNRLLAYGAGILALGLMKDKTAIPLLVKVIEKDKADQFAWSCAVQALGLIGDSQSAEALQKAFKDSVDNYDLEIESYNNLLIALVMVGKRKETIALLNQQLSNKKLGYDLKLRAIHGIGYIGDGSSVLPLCDFYKDEKDEYLRLYALESLSLLLERDRITCYCKITRNNDFEPSRLILDYIFYK